jgi:hypothetical protein
VRALGAVLLLAAAWSPAPLAAQDTHYWNQQYGPVAELLGGVVVGSAPDLSATFYNPGGLAMRDDPGFLLSVQAFQDERVGLTLEGGRGETLKGGGFGSAPSLLAGSLPSGWLGKDTRLAWSFLTRQRFNVRVLTRLSSQRGTLETAAGSANAAAELLFDQRLSEEWGGLTISRRFGNLGVGLTQFVAYRSQRARYELNLQGAGADASGAAVLVVDESDYYHVRTLTKLGAALQQGDLRLGLAVTTPSIGLFGSGKAGFTVSVSGDVDGDGRPDTVLEEDFNQGLKTHYRSPLSVALGASWRRGPSRLHATAEWFDRVPDFVVIEPPSDAHPLDPTYHQHLESVLNLGVGFQHSFSHGVDVYAGFATDRSAAPDTSPDELSLSRWDVFHFTGGVAFSVGSSRFTLGGAYASGTADSEVALLPEPARSAAGPLPTQGSWSYRRLKFLLGYSFGS